ncbi:hypothetical protein ACO11K_004025 [Bacillus cytotoxicus]
MSQLDKFDYIQTIVTKLKATTDINFQKCCGEIFKIYYKQLGKRYEMPNSSGGDNKNDGWVVEDGVFYQIYSPQQHKSTLRKDMQKKFTEDLSTLLNLIINEGKWGQQINSFIFIVNTFDRDLPHDSERYYDTICKSLMDKYNISFTYKIVNTDYFRDEILFELDLHNLQHLSALLSTKNLIDYNAISTTTMYEVIDVLNEKLQEKFFSESSKKNDYKRVSPPTKIVLNHLEKRAEQIEKRLTHMDVVLDLQESINQDLLYNDKFSRIINFIISRYEILSSQYTKEELYDNLIEDIIQFAEFNKSLRIPCEMLIVYIFDKCDIFEKEPLLT